MWCFKPKTGDETRGYGRGCASRALGSAEPRLTARPCDVRDAWNSFWTISPPRHERRHHTRIEICAFLSKLLRAPFVPWDGTITERMLMQWCSEETLRSRGVHDSVPAPALAARLPPTTNPTLAPRQASTRARRAPISRRDTTPRGRTRPGRDHGRRRLTVGRRKRCS